MTLLRPLLVSWFYFRSGEKLAARSPSSLFSVGSTQPSEAANRQPNKLVRVTQEDGGAPIDWVLSRRWEPPQSRRHFRRELESGRVTVDGRVVRSLVRVKVGQTLRMSETIRVDGGSERIDRTSATARPNEAVVRAVKIPGLRVLFEDSHIVVVSKPRGVAVHPCESSTTTVLDGVLWLANEASKNSAEGAALEEGDVGELALRLRQGVVHRLDKDTSGVLVIAKTLGASTALSSQFKRRGVDKRWRISLKRPNFKRLKNLNALRAGILLFAGDGRGMGWLTCLWCGRAAARSSSPKVRAQLTAPNQHAPRSPWRVRVTGHPSSRSHSFPSIILSSWTPFHASHPFPHQFM